MRKAGIILLFGLILIYFVRPDIIFGLGLRNTSGPFLTETNPASPQIDKKGSSLAKFSLIKRTDGKIFPSPVKKKSADFNTFLKTFQPLTFKHEVWTKVAKVKEAAAPPSKPSSLPIQPEGIGFELPYESKLTIYGQKEIELKMEETLYDHKDEKDRTDTPKVPGKNLDINQKLQARIKGQVGRKITVNVDYDDTTLDKRDISVVYKGDPEEVVQEAAFGDIDLSLPSTEFVSYNKKLFGAKLDAKYRRLRFMAIGSRIKGISDYKEFKGRTTFQKKDLYDTSYLQRKYYKLYFTPDHLPLTRGSEQIYIDDQNILSNTPDTKMLTVYDYNSSTTTFTGYFDLRRPGEDYTVDYNKGIITFNKNIGSNYVIAVAYKYATGSVGYNNDYKMIKNENESIHYALKNYYDLGHTKILTKGLLIKIQDLNRDPNTEKVLYENETDKSQTQSPYLIDNLDLDLGVLKFQDETPFPDDVYTINPVHHYFIDVEYKYSINNYNLDRFDIVKESEQVRVDGEKLTRDVDYLIDYELGQITFIKEDLIKEDSNIRIDFEYMPFGGQLQQTLVGARGEFSPYPNWFIGSTALYNSSAQTSSVPDVKGAPETILVLEADSRYKFAPKSVPFNAEISGEIAHSQHTMNDYGKAMIDNMEGIKIEDNMPTSKNLWIPGSNPGQPVDKRQPLNLDNEMIKIQEINPNVKLESLKESEQQVLDLNYNLPEDGSWSAITYPISKSGADYSRRKFLELRIYGNGGGEELNIDLGKVDEDINNDGKLETEDTNKDGELSTGEDVGIDISKDRYGNPTNLASNYGADNGRLDTEDLDGDGLIGQEGFISSYSNLTDVDGIDHTNVNWSGWKAFRIPLGTTSINQDQWKSIKHIRLWLKKGTSTSGTIKIASLSIVGNKWEDAVVEGTGSMIIRAANNEDDADYQSLADNSDFKDIYRRTGQEKDPDDKEQSLSLEYNLNNGADGYTKRVFSTPQDYRDYRKLKFFIYGTNAKGATLDLRLGTPSAYFEFKKQINWTGWYQITLNLNDTNGDYLADEIKYDGNDGQVTWVGSPTLNNVSEIRIGIINGTGVDIAQGKVWINEIYLDESANRKGWAKRIQLNTSYKDWAFLSGNFRTQDRNFETIGKTSDRQDNATFSLDPRFTYLKYLPITGHFDKSKTVTPNTTGTGLSSSAEGTVERTNWTIGTNFSYKKFPNLNTTVSQILQGNDLQQRKDRTDTFSETGTYDIPTKFFLFPKALKAGYTRTNSYINYKGREGQPGYEKSLENSDDWSSELDFHHSWGKNESGNFTLTPSYKIKKAELEKELRPLQKIRNPKYSEQTVGLNSSLKVFNWFTPQVNGNVTSRDDYNTEPSSYTVLSKNIRRDSIVTGRLPLAAANLMPKSKVLKSLNITPDYKMERRDNYENVKSDFPTLDKLWVSDKLKIEQDPKTIYANDDFKTELRWKPLEFLELKRGLRPLRTLDTKVKYNNIKDYRETTGTPSDTNTTIWPDLQFIFSDVEYIPLFYKFMEGGRFTTAYSKKEIDKKSISLTKYETWKFEWNFTLFKRYIWILEYQDTVSQDTNPEGKPLSSSISQAAGAQLNFRMLENLRFKLRYNDKRTVQRADTSSFSTAKTPSINMETDLRFPRGLRLPLIKNPLQFKNALKVSNTIQANFERSNVAKNNKKTYSGDLRVDYDVSANFMFTMGGGLSRVEYIEESLSKNNYWTYNVLSKLLIKF